MHRNAQIDEHNFPVGIFISVYFICIYGKTKLNIFPPFGSLNHSCAIF